MKLYFPLKNHRDGHLWFILTLPMSIFLVFFFTIPLLFVFFLSFAQRGEYGNILWNFGLQNYMNIFSENMLYIFIRSLTLACLTTVTSVTCGFFSAWAAVTYPLRIRTNLLLLISMPFFVSMIVRVYALKFTVGARGPVQWLLEVFHIPFDPFAMTANQVLVAVGMFLTYFPFAVLPLYSAFDKFDFTILEAAYDLGASHGQALRRVLFPVLRPAILNSAVLVFTPSLGEFVIPELLGGGKNLFLGSLISEKFLKARDWPLGAALTMILIVLFLALVFWFNHRDSLQEK